MCVVIVVIQVFAFFSFFFLCWHFTHCTLIFFNVEEPLMEHYLELTIF
jgi:hypothetical protein